MANQENKVVRTDAYYSVMSGIKGVVAGKERAAHAETKASDVAYSEGLRWWMCKSPSKDTGEAVHCVAGTEISLAQLFSDLKETVVHGMPATQRKLILAPKAEVKDWTDDAKVARKTAQQKIGPYVKSIARQLYLREHGSADNFGKDWSGKGADNTTPKTPKEKILARLDDVIKYAQKDEAPDYDATMLVKQIEAVKATI
jgi:hypothetical protein